MKHKWVLKGSFKKQSALRKLRAALLSTSLALLILSAAIYVAQWKEGKAAEQSAQILLQASGIKPQISSPSTGSFVEPEQTETIEDKYKDLDVVARLDITPLNLSLPVLSETTKSALKASVCRYLGERPNGGSNYVITGHNYRNGALFGNLDKAKIGFQVLLTDKSGETHFYTIYAIEHIKPDQIDCLTDEKYAEDLSLLTCEKRGNGRLLLRCSPSYPETNRP